MPPHRFYQKKYHQIILEIPPTTPFKAKDVRQTPTHGLGSMLKKLEERGYLTRPKRSRRGDTWEATPKLAKLKEYHQNHPIQ